MLILLLIKLGTSGEEIGVALKVHPSRVTQLIPLSKIKRIRFQRQ